ncbi:MAG: hypothetical protein H5T74_00160 [Actinobacteria bacterium]|nr:hypothetical protein [Actinomycetota bacterium]MDI6831742.1 hypothetical protein [Actinomycetota bacterium]
MGEVEREFFKRYHRAVVKANAGEVEKVKAKIGSEWAEEFRARAGGRLEGEEFNRALEDYLENELRFCEEAEVRGEGEELSIAVKGCHICHGNELLKAEGQPALCPIVPTGLFSISRVAGRRASLREVRKNGVVGECEICYVTE